MDDLKDIDSRLCLWAGQIANQSKKWLGNEEVRLALISDINVAVDEIRRLRKLEGSL